jgi:arylsulfatase
MWKTPWEQTYPALLRANGYHVGHVGKWHNKPFPKGKYDFATVYHGKHWYDDPDNPGKQIHVTQRNERDALEVPAHTTEGQTLCRDVCFFAARPGPTQGSVPARSPNRMKLYKNVKIPVPANMTTASWERLPEFFDEKNEGRNRWHWRFDTPEKYQRMMKNYYRLASEVDATCGIVLKELKKQGARQHAGHLHHRQRLLPREHGLADKWYPHQESSACRW